MNKKGISLIEMVMAIMILSIAGFMIVSGFMAVFRFISMGNDIQNESNVLLSYAEKSTDTQILDQVQVQRANTTYSITNDEGKSVTVKGKIDALTPTVDGKISLHVISNETNALVKDTPSYILAMKKADKLYKAVNDMIKNPPYANIFKTIFLDTYHSTWDSFASELLPKALRDTAPASKPFKIVGFFPWEYIENAAFTNSSPLIYLSQDYTTETPTTKKEILHVIYDYIDSRWYYYPGNDYEIVYEGYDIKEPAFLYKGKNQEIRSYEKLINHIKQANSGWYALDEDMEYDSSDPDHSWLPIT